MFIPRYVVLLAVAISSHQANCSPIQQTTLNDVFDLKSLEKSAAKFLDNIEKTRSIRFNDFVSVETIGNATRSSQSNPRLLDKLEDISNTKSLKLNLGFADVKLSRDAGRFDLDVKVDPREEEKKDEKEGQMLLPVLIGLKVTTLVLGVVSFIALMTLKAFIASKTAILIAAIIGLKKLFGGHHKKSYEAVFDRYSVGPEYHVGDQHAYAPEVFKGNQEIMEHNSGGVYDLLKEHKDLVQENNDAPKYEFQRQESPDQMPNGQEFHGLFGNDLQEFKHESQQKRRSWKNNGKRKPLSLIIGIPHHEPPVLTYRKVVTGRNS